MNIKQLFDFIPQWIGDNSIDSENLLIFAACGIVLGLLFAAISVGVISLLSKKKFIKGRSLFVPFAIVWVCAFAVYDVGMYTGEWWSLLTNAPMAILYAFGVFILESDISAIHDTFYNSGWFMFAFSVTHFAAVGISVWFILKHFGFNIIAAFKRFFAKTCIRKAKKTTYLFWGMNNATYHLAKSINEHHKKANDGSYRIIIVRTSKEADTTPSLNGIGRLFNFLSLNDKDMEKLRDIEECITSNTFVSLADLNVSSLGAQPDVFRALGLKTISKLISKKTSGEVHVLFLSDDEPNNIKGVANLRRDKVFMEKADTSATIFYCHARDNSMNRVLEEQEIVNNVEVRIVDTSHLSIECLKRDVRYQPVSFVEIDKENNYGTVLSPFTSLVVGFGETGKDALRFLYEFGAFVDGTVTTGTYRSPFCCHVVDKQLDNIKGPFMNAAPRLFSNKNVMLKPQTPLVTLHSIDYNSDEFFNDLLAKLAPTLNYVVIAIGSDEAGMTLSVRILKYLRRQGRDFSKLRIFVRSYDSTLYPHMEKIRQHYNEQEERIVLFGNEKELFTYDMIIVDEFEQRGKEYYESYRSLNPEHDEDGSWMQRRKKLKGLITLKKTQIDPTTGCPVFAETTIDNPAKPSLEALQKLRRKEVQDKANALHEATKIHILENIVPNWYNQLVPCLFEFVNTGQHVIIRRKRKHLDTNVPKEVKYELEPKDQLLMDNLARLEHVRWNASHEVLGYIPMPDTVPNEKRGCDETTATHNCLVSWEELDAESDKVSYVKDYKIYDYGVVETTIDIYRRLREKKLKTETK